MMILTNKMNPIFGPSSLLEVQLRTGKEICKIWAECNAAPKDFHFDDLPEGSYLKLAIAIAGSFYLMRSSLQLGVKISKHLAVSWTLYYFHIKNKT